MATLDPQTLIIEANAIYEEWHKLAEENDLAPSHEHNLNLLGYLVAASVQVYVNQGHTWPELGNHVTQALRAAFEMGRASAA